MTELLRGLAALAERPSPEHAGLARLLGLPGRRDPADHAQLFLLQLPPFASIYVGREGQIGGEARDRIAGFWRALGAEPPAEPDHLATLLATQAELREAEEGCATRTAASRRHRRRAFFWEHLASWLFAYLDAVEQSSSAFYRRWARLLRRALLEEAAILGPPPVAPLHLRSAPGLPGAEETDLDDVLAALLAPVRSGLILPRDRLHEAGLSLGIATRGAGSRWLLRELLTAEPEAMLAWLCGEAERQARRQRAAPAALQPVAAHWAARGEATAAWLRAQRPVGAALTHPLEG